MPIVKNTQLITIPGILTRNISRYNSCSRGAGYNCDYKQYIDDRDRGVKAYGSLADWIANGGAASSIMALLNNFGMNAHNSKLVPLNTLQKTLTAINPQIINWISGFSLPFNTPPPALINRTTNTTLSTELQLIYDALARRGSVTNSGGFVVASKTMHCLFPELCPIIDGRHTGISYYNIDRATYTPPLGFNDWIRWVGVPIYGVANPSPRGAGRNAWQWQQFIAAMGINQHIYELWQAANGNLGYSAFLALDQTPGTTGIPRIIDKGLW